MMERLDTTHAPNVGRTNTKQQSNFSITLEAIETFKQAMFDNGITPPESIIADGVLHRFKIDGKLNGAYVLHLDGKPAGYFEDFKQGIKQTWKSEGQHKRLSDNERRAFKVLAAKQAHDRRIAEVNRHNQAAIKAGFIWHNSLDAPGNHPYLIRKQIKPHGVHVYKQALVIPIFSHESQLVNLQFIDAEGNKRFLSGGKKKGCFFNFGTEKTHRILIAEGFATGASLFENCGYLTVVAFDAGNLKDVAIVIKSLYPDSEIIICGDNDLNGVGQKKAIEAALACRGKYIVPPKAGTDFNDVVNAGGK